MEKYIVKKFKQNEVCFEFCPISGRYKKDQDIYTYFLHIFNPFV
jgi:hypothetical protein